MIAVAEIACSGSRSLSKVFATEQERNFIYSMFRDENIRNVPRRRIHVLALHLLGSLTKLWATAVKHPALPRWAHHASVPRPVVIYMRLIVPKSTHQRMRIMITVTESKPWAARPWLKVFISRHRGRAQAKEAIFLVELLPLLATATTHALGLLRLHGAAGKPLPSLGNVAYYRI